VAYLVHTKTEANKSKVSEETVQAYSTQLTQLHFATLTH